jgi:hypothetical protein
MIILGARCGPASDATYHDVSGDGRHVRVGLEDSLMIARGQLAKPTRNRFRKSVASLKILVIGRNPTEARKKYTGHRKTAPRFRLSSAYKGMMKAVLDERQWADIQTLHGERNYPSIQAPRRIEVLRAVSCGLRFSTDAGLGPIATLHSRSISHS